MNKNILQAKVGNLLPLNYKIYYRINFIIQFNYFYLKFYYLNKNNINEKS